MDDEWNGNRNGSENGGSAFPFVSQGGYEQHQLIDEGMSLRDWFAGQALTGELAALKPLGLTYGQCENYAAQAFMLADAMLAARNANRGA